MSQNAVSPNEITFNCFAVAFPYPSYSWSTPRSVTDLMTSRITFMAVFGSFGNYTCTASSNGVDATSDTAVLTGNFLLCRFTYSVICSIYNTYMRISLLIILHSGNYTAFNTLTWGLSFGIVEHKIFTYDYPN